MMDFGLQSMKKLKHSDLIETKGRLHLVLLSQHHKLAFLLLRCRWRSKKNADLLLLRRYNNSDQTVKTFSLVWQKRSIPLRNNQLRKNQTSRNLSLPYVPSILVSISILIFPQEIWKCASASPLWWKPNHGAWTACRIEWTVCRNA